MSPAPDQFQAHPARDFWGYTGGFAIHGITKFFWFFGVVHFCRTPGNTA